MKRTRWMIACLWISQVSQAGAQSATARFEALHGESAGSHWMAVTVNGAWLDGRRVLQDTDIPDTGRPRLAFSRDGHWITGSSRGVWVDGRQVLADGDVPDGSKLL